MISVLFNVALLAIWKTPNAVLTVQTKDPEAAQSAVDEILEVDTKGWKFVEPASLDDGRSTLNYLVRTRKSVPPSAVLERLKTQGAPHIVTAEFRPLERLEVQAGD